MDYVDLDMNYLSSNSIDFSKWNPIRVVDQYDELGKYLDSVMMCEPVTAEMRTAEFRKELATARSLQTPVALMMFIQSADLPDTKALEVSSFYEDWSPNSIAYSKGDLRRRGLELYRCLQDHTSQATWTPEDAVSLWAHIVPPGEIQEWHQPDSTNPYMKGDKAIFEGATYESIIDNNVWAPTVTGWSKV